VKFHDEETDKRFVFLTNNFTLPALIIAKIYKSRWKVELFFKINFELYTILQILSLTLFDKSPLLQTLIHSDYIPDSITESNQLLLFTD